MSRANIPHGTLTSEDVTQEYLEAAVPGQGAITYEIGYQVKVHQGEIYMAHWLHRTFGGDIKLLKESKEQGDKTPDFLWNGRQWELKGVTSQNSIERAVREAAKQIQKYPGGIILDTSSSTLSQEAIEDAISQRVRRIALTRIDILIVSNGMLKKIIRYTK